MTMLVVLAAVLLIDGVSAGYTVKDLRKRYLPLDMAPNSVDDMYSSCKQDMSNVVGQYLQNEKNTHSKFKAAWDYSVALYNKRFRRSKPFLGRERIVALYVYTFGQGDIYRDFNDAVRVEGPQYKTSFGFHALHFYLTSAIQNLNFRRRRNLQPGEDECLTSYRRVGRSYHQDVVNTQFRFGSFASSSLGQYSNAGIFGDKSCFEIYTCMGADVSMYSKFENEGEVLIPPYEVFKVVGVEKRSQQQPDLPCEVVYRVRSTATSVSRLDCALFPK